MVNIDPYTIVYGKPSPTALVNAFITESIKGVPASWLIASIALSERVDPVLTAIGDQFEISLHMVWDARAETTHKVPKNTDVAHAKPAMANACVRKITSANFGIQLERDNDHVTLEVSIVAAKEGGFDLCFLNDYAKDPQVGPTWHLKDLSAGELRRAIVGLVQGTKVRA